MTHSIFICQTSLIFLINNLTWLRRRSTNLVGGFDRGNFGSISPVIPGDAEKVEGLASAKADGAAVKGPSLNTYC
jgi:hypothetical protein